jgi:hypothetical protein
MAKSSAKRPAKAAPPKSGGGIRPVLLAAGLGLYWFVEYQDAGGPTDAPIWGYMVMVGVRVLVDFVGALVVVSSFRLVLALARLALSYLRGWWLQESRG